MALTATPTKKRAPLKTVPNPTEIFGKMKPGVTRKRRRAPRRSGDHTPRPPTTWQAVAAK